MTGAWLGAFGVALLGVLTHGGDDCDFWTVVLLVVAIPVWGGVDKVLRRARERQ